MKTVDSMVCVLGLCVATALAGEPAAKPAAAKLRIGTYDSRAVAMAYTGTEWFHKWRIRAQAAEAKAKAEGKDVPAELMAQAIRTHQQGFSTAPVDDLLANIKDKLPGIAKAAGVSAMVSKWDKEALAKYKSAERVDVTMALVNAMTTDPHARQQAVNIMKSKPVSMKGRQSVLEGAVVATRGPSGGLMSPTAERDQYGNPVLPKEMWLTQPRIEFVLIPAGEFMMGSQVWYGRSKEKPVHKVRLTKPFYLSKYEVTQGQYEGIVGRNPSRFKGANNPVERVSWEDCQGFVKKLGPGFRLPTEAEWEYACRAGSTTRYCCGSDSSALSDYAWYSKAGGKTHPVGQKKPNAWGLYDMHGNVFEWCQDRWGKYPTGSVTDPTGPTGGYCRAFRGGGWDVTAGGCRSAFREGYVPEDRDDNLGCRLALRSSP